MIWVAAIVVLLYEIGAVLAYGMMGGLLWSDRSKAYKIDLLLVSLFSWLSVLLVLAEGWSRKKDGFKFK